MCQVRRHGCAAQRQNILGSEQYGEDQPQLQLKVKFLLGSVSQDANLITRRFSQDANLKTCLLYCCFVLLYVFQTN